MYSAGADDHLECVEKLHKLSKNAAKVGEVWLVLVWSVCWCPVMCRLIVTTWERLLTWLPHYISVMYQYPMSAVYTGTVQYSTVCVMCVCVCACVCSANQQKVFPCIHFMLLIHTLYAAQGGPRTRRCSGWSYLFSRMGQDKTGQFRKIQCLIYGTRQKILHFIAMLVAYTSTRNRPNSIPLLYYMLGV